MDMQSKRPGLAVIFVSLLAVGSLTGCQSASYAQRGAGLGTALGGATGAIIGHQSGQGAEGALIGAAAGAITGGLIGDAQDARAERDAAIAQANYAQQMPALNNQELIRMAQSGLSDGIIINSIGQRGGQFDLSPDGLIFLKSNGVSDAVIEAVQRSCTATTYVGVASAPPVQGVVVVSPRPAAKIVLLAPRRAPHYVVPRRRW